MPIINKKIHTNTEDIKKAAQNHIEKLQKDECSHHQAAEMHWLYRKKRQKALPDLPGRAAAKMLLHFHNG